MKQNKNLNLLIVGGVAGGASAAARARRLSESARITVIERGPDVSFANCGMPYFIGQIIKDRGKLAVHTPESLQKMLNLEIRTGTEAVRINRARKTVTVRKLGSRLHEELPYDKLILSTGAVPLKPPLPGVDDPRVVTLRNLQEMDRIDNLAGEHKSAVVIGAGFIGLEITEALVERGLAVTLVEAMDQILPPMDEEMTRFLTAEILKKKVSLILNDKVKEFSPAPGELIIRLASGKVIEAGFAVLSVGVRPDTGLAREAGLKLGLRDSIEVNAFQQTSDPDIYAVGDAAQTQDSVLGGPVVVPLGGPASRQGRVAADHIFMGNEARPYPGTLGTAIVKCFGATAALTGWTAKRLACEKIPFQSVVVTALQHASYYPGAVPLVLKITWSPDDGRILGAQAAGADGVDKRIDVLSAAITGGLTIDDLCHLEMAYAPPFGSARDVVNVAGFVATNIEQGLVDPVWEMPDPKKEQVVDVRPAVMAGASPLPDIPNIPVDELRARMGELDRTRPVVTVCALGKMSYFAARVLQQNGFNARCFLGGINLLRAGR